jgi:hypothetical protein
MQYTTEMGWDTMIHIPIFIYTGSGIQNVIGPGGGGLEFTNKQTACRSHEPTLIFPKISGLNKHFTFFITVIILCVHSWLPTDWLHEVQTETREMQFPELTLTTQPIAFQKATAM